MVSSLEREPGGRREEIGALPPLTRRETEAQGQPGDSTTGGRPGGHTPEGRQPESPPALGTGQTDTRMVKSAFFCTVD